MANDKNWMQSAVSKPGALRQTASLHQGIDKKTGNIKQSFINDAIEGKYGEKTAKRANLAKTFNKYRPD